MKSTGIVRKIDGLGRVVLPIELRRLMNLGENAALEIFVDGDEIVLKKYQPACIFCGEAKGVVSFEGRNIRSEERRVGKECRSRWSPYH